MKWIIFSVYKYLVVTTCIILVAILLSSFQVHSTFLNFNPKPKTHIVTIFKMKYSPANISVRKGDTVVWINKDFVPHDVTEEVSHKWTSKPFKQGERWYKVIHEDIKYYCNLHKVMKGTISINN